MDDRAEGAHRDADPPNGRIVAVHVIHSPPKPDPEKTAQLVAEKHDSIQGTHVAQTIDVSDQPACQGNGGQPQGAHDDREHDHGRRSDREQNEQRRRDGPSRIDQRKQVFFGIPFAEPARRQCARDVRRTDYRDGDGPER